jgi:hypothetical protein
MNTARQEGPPASGRESGPRRFPRHLADEAAAHRRFEPDSDALAEALHVVRALDADSYQALLWALGLTPDPRLSVPGCASPKRGATSAGGREPTA